MPRPSARPPALPRVLEGKFEVIEVLSQGTELVSFLAQHRGIHRLVELHTLGDGVLWPSPASERLFRMARVQGSISHPAVQGVIDVGRDPEGRPFVVYEAVRGTAISALAGHSTFDEARAGRLLFSMLEALRAVHRARVVARVLSPETVLVLSNRGEGERVKLRAFEYGAFMGDDPSAADELPYSPWLAPELRRDARVVDPRSDVFAAGMMLRHLLHGTSKNVRPLPSTSHRTIERATAEDPDHRFPTIDVFMQAAALLCEQEDGSNESVRSTDEDPLAASLHHLSRRQATGHARRELSGGHARVQALPALLAVRAVYETLGDDRWSALVGCVPEAQTLLSAANQGATQSANVCATSFSALLRHADEFAGSGDGTLSARLGETVARRAFLQVLPALPRLANPEVVLDAFPYLLASITMQGRVQDLERNEHLCRIVVRGQIEPYLELSGFIAGFLRGALCRVGASSPWVELLACEAVGDAVDIYRVELG